MNPVSVLPTEVYQEVVLVENINTGARSSPKKKTTSKYHFLIGESSYDKNEVQNASFHNI